MFYKILLLVLSSCIQTYYSQQTASVWYDTDNGLPQNSVKDITKDQYGFIWLSTENGLVRYDGNNFVTYNRLNLKNNRFTSFFGNSKKDTIYNLTAYNENTTLISKRNVNVLLKPTDCIRKVLNKSKSYSIFIKNGVLQDTDHKKFFIYFDKKNYYQLSNDGTIQYQQKIIAPVKGLRENYILDTFCFGSNIFIISRTLKKIIKISSDKVTYLDAPAVFFQKNIKVYWSQINNQSFIIDDSILYKVTYENNALSLKKIAVYDVKSSLSSIYHDEVNHKLYLGTLSDGLNVIKFNNFHVVNKSDRSYENIFYSQLPLDTDKVITSSGDVYSEKGLLKQYHFKTASRYFLLYDDKKNILVQDQFSLLRFLSNTNYSKKEQINFGKTASYAWNINGYYVVAFNEQPLKTQLVFYKDADFKTPFAQFSIPNVVTSIQEYGQNKWLLGIKNIFIRPV